MSTFLKEKLGFSIFLSGVALATFWSSVTLGRFACGRLTLRMRIPVVVGILSASAFVAVLLSGLIPSARVYWLIIVLTGLSFSSMHPLLLSYGVDRELPISTQTAAFAILTACSSIGNTIIPWLTGLIGEKAGIQAAMSGPSIVFLLIVIILCVVSRMDRGKASNTLTQTVVY
jgi:fucose permease